MSDQYRIEAVTPNSSRIAEEAKLLSTVFPNTAKYTTEYLTWQYYENPDGEVVGFDAYAPDGTIAAHYVTQPLRATIDGRTVRGVLSLNTATHPDHQGKGLFVKLATETYTRAKELGYEFVIGVANANSTPGFIRKLDFQLVAPLEVRVGIGSVRCTGEAVDPAFRRAWSLESRSWRLRNPEGAYWTQNGRLYSRTDTPFIKMILGNDEWATAPGSHPFAPVTAWMGLHPSVRWKGVAIPLPKRLRPSPLNFIYRDLTGRRPRLDPGNVSMDAIAFDAY